MDTVTYVLFALLDAEKYKMSHDYAAITASLSGALLAVGAFEMVNVQRSLGAERHKLDIMFAEDLKEIATAHRTGTPIPPSRERAVAGRVRLYLLLRDVVDRGLTTLYWLWGFTIMLNVFLLQNIMRWAALADGGSAPLLAALIWHGAMLATTATCLNCVMRFAWLRGLTMWEERVELANRMGLPPAEMYSLMRTWGRHIGKSW